MNHLQKILCLSASTLALVTSSVATFAGGPLNLNPIDPDNVERWGNGGLNIPFNPDQGGLGALNNAEAVAFVEQAFQTWEDVPTSTASYSNNGLLPFDVDETNFLPFVNLLFGTPSVPDGLSPIVFDEDGAIFDTLFGVGSGVLGFASADTFDANGVPIEGVAFFNGGFALADEDQLGVHVHEYGHYSGLAHTVVNGQNIALGDQSGPSPDNTFGNSPVDQTETMYPFIIIGGGESTPHADDIATLSFLYPSPTYFSSTATITGSVLAPNSTTPLTGVNVIARNVDNPFVDAVSAISGDRGPTGEFTINGLTPGADYVVYVDQVLQGGFSTPPIGLPGAEEFYNGVNESSDGLIDVPGDFVTLATAAGASTDNINIIFNGPTAGVPLNVGDDGSQEVFLPFNFRICGRDFDSVFINANGNLTFGAPSNSFSENTAELLGGPPRIAGIWDDLNPSAGGSVVFDVNPFAFTVRWQDVPEFPNTGANTFELVLKRNFFNLGSGKSGPRKKGNAFDLRFDNGTAVDGIVGFSCGGGITSEFETATDISRLRRLTPNLLQTARFEVFTPDNPNDLIDGDSLLFLKTKSFSDVFESNNSLDDNQFVFLPFNSTPNYLYTEISPDGDDVDYYGFFAKAGKTLIAEIQTGQLDTLIGLFDLNGNLLAADDDGGANLLSQIILPIEETGFYFLAVSTFPDFEFTGAGGLGNRYVVDIRTVDGIPIAMGDDNSVEIPLSYDFPFQGQVFNSVFLNANGNLTFGAGSGDFSESVSELLSGPARIAPLWDDLSPNAGGLVLLNNQADSTSVTFVNVPQFFSSDSNNFTVSIDASGDIFIDYGQVDAVDAVVGISEGAGAIDPGASDLSAMPDNSATGTTYELFDFSNNFDLDDAILSFE